MHSLSCQKLFCVKHSISLKTFAKLLNYLTTFISRRTLKYSFLCSKFIFNDFFDFFIVKATQNLRHMPAIFLFPGNQIKRVFSPRAKSTLKLLQNIVWFQNRSETYLNKHINIIFLKQKKTFTTRNSF